MRACAFTLLNSSDIDPVLDQAELFAGALMSADQVLPYWAIDSGFDVKTLSSSGNAVH